MPELKDVIAQLVELKVSPEDFATALKTGAQPLYQSVFDAGHKVATAENKETIRELKEERDELKTAKDDLQVKLTKAEEKQPDVAKIRKEYDDEVKKLTDENKELKRTHKQELKGVRLEARREQLIALTTGLGVDRDYAKMKVSEHFGRVDLDSDGKPIVKQTGKDIPIQSDDPLKALAEEIKAATPAKFLVSNADTGSGTQGEGGTSTSKGFYDGIRQSVQKKEKSESKGTSAAERLGATQGQPG